MGPCRARIWSLLAYILKIYNTNKQNKVGGPMSVFEQLKEKSASLAVVGLGYVGMPIAVAFAREN